MTTTAEQIAEVRRAKEAAVEAEDWETLADLRRQETDLITQQHKEFKPNSRGA